MPITAKLLKDVTAEARPIIERQLADAKIISGFQKVIAANGGDWGALKALIKAYIEDENDEAGDSKRVQKILDKADSSTAYADMLGLAKMNEKNYSAPREGNEYAAAKGAAAEQRANVHPQHEVRPADDQPGDQATVQNECVTAGETATISPLADLPQPSAPEGDSPPAQSSGAAPFINPRCQHSDTCHFADSREACHECLMAWAQRPRDEQCRLWAAANEAARAAV